MAFFEKDGSRIMILITDVKCVVVHPVKKILKCITSNPFPWAGRDEVSNMVALCHDHHSKCDHNSIGKVDEDGYLIQGNAKLKLLKSAVKRINGKS